MLVIERGRLTQFKKYIYMMALSDKVFWKTCNGKKLRTTLVNFVLCQEQIKNCNIPCVQLLFFLHATL